MSIPTLSPDGQKMLGEIIRRYGRHTTDFLTAALAVMRHLQAQEETRAQRARDLVPYDDDDDDDDVVDVFDDDDVVDVFDDDDDDPLGDVTDDDDEPTFRRNHRL